MRWRGFQRVPAYSEPDPYSSEAHLRACVWLMTSCTRCRNAMEYLMWPPSPACSWAGVMWSRFRCLPDRHAHQHLGSGPCADDVPPHPWQG